LDCTTNLEREVEAAPNVDELVDSLGASNRRLNESFSQHDNWFGCDHNKFIRFTWSMVDGKYHVLFLHLLESNLS